MKKIFVWSAHASDMFSTDITVKVDNPSKATVKGTHRPFTSFLEKDLLFKDSALRGAETVSRERHFLGYAILLTNA